MSKFADSLQCLTGLSCFRRNFGPLSCEHTEYNASTIVVEFYLEIEERNFPFFKIVRFGTQSG
ncbi:MAG: hypothetical protein HUJ51_05185 [Eggerthellaceae bacterium]|nr:hypothetical protein [Eggerthellaceae bacterium]